MTIYLYSGTPGSGKSYHAVSDIVFRLRHLHLPVIANFHVSDNLRGIEHFHFVDNSELEPEKLVQFAVDYWSDETHEFREDAIMLVIDECQLLFNSREWNDKRRMRWLQFFSQHRHYGYKVIFIAQFDKMVDRQIRSLIEYEYVHRKFSNMSKLLAWLDTVCRGLFLVVHKYYPLGIVTGSNLVKYRKKVAKAYDSYMTVFAALQDTKSGNAHRLREGAEGGSLRSLSAIRKAETA